MCESLTVRVAQELLLVLEVHLVPQLDHVKLLRAVIDVRLLVTCQHQQYQSPSV